MTTTSPSRARVLAALALTTAAVLAAGCTVEVSGPDDVPGPGAREDGPLLRADDVGPDHRVDPDPAADDDLTRAGCLSAVDALGAGATERWSVTFTTDDALGGVVVAHTVLGFDDPAAAAGALDGWRGTATSCHAVEHVEQDATLRLDVTTDTEPHGRAVTEEVNLVATGEVDSGPVDVGVSQWVSVARVEDHLSVVRVLDLVDDDAADEGRRLARIGADRLDAWAR
ncbi:MULTISPECIES: hypothetical protein [unclassified Geodermatophilus]